MTTDSKALCIHSIELMASGSTRAGPRRILRDGSVAARGVRGTGMGVHAAVACLPGSGAAGHTKGQAADWLLV